MRRIRSEVEVSQCLIEGIESRFFTLLDTQNDEIMDILR